MQNVYGNTVAEYINNNVFGGSTSKPLVTTEWWDEDNSEWVEFEDVISRELSLSTENKRYFSYSFLPPVQELSFVLDNSNQIYSTGSGNSKASILKKNLLVRCRSGFEIPGIGATAEYVDDLATDVKLYHTATLGGKIYPDITSASGTISPYAWIDTYDKFNYDERRYSAEGYYYKKIEFGDGLDSNQKIYITTSSDKFDLKYRVGNYGWSPYFPLSTGANELFVDSRPNVDSTELIVRFRSGSWATAGNWVSDIKVLAQRKGYLFERGTFVIDEPEYSKTVTVKGRDQFKRALETEITLPDWSTAIHTATAIAYILDRCNIGYNTSEWDIPTSTIALNGTLAEKLTNTSGWKLLDHLMDAVNSESGLWWCQWSTAGNFILKNTPLRPEQDYIFDWRYHLEGVSKNFNADKQLQRVTVVNQDITLDPEITLKSISGTTSSPYLNITYATAMYVRFDDSTDVITSEISRGNTGVYFSVNSGAAYNITAYGCRPKSSTPAYAVFGEAGNINSQKNNDGQTHKIVNPFLKADQCQAVAQYLIRLWGDPPSQMNIEMTPNPYIELNDNAFVIDRYTSTDDIFRIAEIKETWNPSKLKHSIILKDTGYAFTQQIWDKNGRLPGVLDVLWDSGLTWDYDLKVNGSDTAVYKKIKNMTPA